MIKLKRVLASVTALLFTASAFTGCGRNTGEDIKASIQTGNTIAFSVDGEVNSSNRQAIEWKELDQLKNYKEFRDNIDYILNVIKFDVGSKNGVIYIDENGNWTGNNVLFNAYKNKEYVKNIKNNEVLTAIKEAVNSEFSTSYNGTVAYIAMINTYFNILPNLSNDGNADTDIIMETISRKDAMTAIARCDTPVQLTGGENIYDTAFGNDPYNTYAVLADNNSFLKSSDGSLNAYSYNAPITFGEMIYLIITRYYSEEFNNLDINDAFVPDCTNLGNIWEEYSITEECARGAYELETALQRGNCMPDDVYRAMSVAYNIGIIDSGASWSDSVSLGELLTYLIATYETMYTDTSYPVNARTGKNKGNELIGESAGDIEKEEVEIGDIQKEEIKKADEIDEVLKKYADVIDMTDEEIETLKKDSEGFEFEWVDTTLKVDYCEYLNLRSGPSTDYPILRSIPVGTETHIIARCTENGWYRVIADGVVAYQCGYYFSDLNGNSIEDIEIGNKVGSESIEGDNEKAEESNEDTKEINENAVDSESNA